MNRLGFFFCWVEGVKKLPEKRVKHVQFRRDSQDKGQIHQADPEQFTHPQY